MSRDLPLLKLKNVSKFYYNKGLVSTGFTKVNVEFNLGEFVVITGESGSGKSTLLNVLSGLDSYEEGEMFINGEETSHYSESDFEKYRKTYIGNIFQSFNLVNSYTVYQNIELVLLLNGFKKKDIHNKILGLIKEVDLYKFRNTKVAKLSGGQKQRVAIARALAKDTPIIIADEPTGNLDTKSAKGIIKLLSEIAKDKLVIIVTHNYDQVEAYATRKIEMYDGKIREDINLLDYNKKTPKVYEYKDIRKSSEIILGIRNSFNIFSKFILTFIVFLFIVIAFLGEYSLFKKLEEEEAKYGYNYYFSNTDVNRIVIKKKDNNFITDKDFAMIESYEEVAKIEKDDLLLDTTYNLNNDDYYFWGKFENYENIKEVSLGRLPEKDNEVVVKGYVYDYYLSNNPDEVFNQELKIYDDNGVIINIDGPLKIVGIIYCDDYDNDTFYVSDAVIDKVREKTNVSYSELTISLGDDFNVGRYDHYMRISSNKNVPKGSVFIAEDMNYLCENTCQNKDMKIHLKNIYYEENLNLKVDKYYTKNTFKTLTGLDNYDNYNGIIFISEEDYNELYNKYTFQSSIFANSMNKVDELALKLNDLGFDTLVIKDTLYNPSQGIVEIINIFRLIVTIVLFIVLFFITYFVIKLIQKSKNVYYSTVRILGGSKKVIRNLITTELFTIYHLTYFMILLSCIFSKYDLINLAYLKKITNYLALKDFIIIYLVLLLMSLLLSYTYSRKLFKASAMKTYREEV